VTITPYSNRPTDDVPDGNFTKHDVSKINGKAYLIAHIEVADLQRYALYDEAEDDAFARYGGRFLVRGGQQHTLTGQLKTRTIVIEFENIEAAMGFYSSMENQGAKSMRLAIASADAIIVQGYDDA
jgi:uncharacterized protein (DUF1330 family)